MIAQPDLFDMPAPRLKPQAQAVLRILRERGSLTPAEARDLVGTDRLAARILEIRSAYGEASVGMILEANANGGHHARYFWRG